MENSKVEMVFLIFSSPFSFLPRLAKNVFFRFLGKLQHNLIFIVKIKKSKLFSQLFSFTSSFLHQLIKNVLKDESNFSFSDFYENCHMI